MTLHINRCTVASPSLSRRSILFTFFRPIIALTLRPIWIQNLLRRHIRHFLVHFYWLQVTALDTPYTQRRARMLLTIHPLLIRILLKLFAADVWIKNPFILFFTPPPVARNRLKLRFDIVKYGKLAHSVWFARDARVC